MIRVSPTSAIPLSTTTPARPGRRLATPMPYRLPTHLPTPTPPPPSTPRAPSPTIEPEGTDDSFPIVPHRRQRRSAGRSAVAAVLHEADADAHAEEQPGVVRGVLGSQFAVAVEVDDEAGLRRPLPDVAGQPG